MSEPQISNNPTQHQYEIRVDGERAGFAQYTEPDADHVDFVHTVVEDAYAGQGLASKLVGYAVADVRDNGKRVIPHCPYVQAWLRKHDEYADIVDWPG